MSEPTKSEQRELLMLQCQLSRLKIDTARKKARMRRAGEENTAIGQMLDLVGSIPRHTLMKTALLPMKWQYRILASIALLLFENRQNKR